MDTNYLHENPEYQHMLESTGATHWGYDKAEPKYLDPEIIPALDLINKSGWVWSIFSCAGHETGTHGPSNAGSSHDEVYVSVVTRNDNVDEVIALMKSVLEEGQRFFTETNYVYWFNPAEYTLIRLGIKANTQETRIAARKTFERFGKVINRSYSDFFL